MTNVNATGTTLLFQREFSHPPEKVWAALTDPSQLDRWAPFYPDRNLSSAGPAVLTMVDGDVKIPMTATVLRAEPPFLLEYVWDTDLLRWEIEAIATGTRLSLHHTVKTPEWLPMVAAGWHICLDVAARLMDGDEVEAIRGQEAMKHGWQELHDRYAQTLHSVG